MEKYLKAGILCALLSEYQLKLKVSEKKAISYQP